MSRFGVPSTLHPLVERFDECCRRVELKAVFTPLLYHPSPSLSFHFTLQLPFCLVTPLFPCLSLSPLICSSVAFSSPSLFLTSFLFRPHPTAQCHSINCLVSVIADACYNGLMISQCTVIGGSMDLFISCHPFIMKR